MNNKNLVSDCPGGGVHGNPIWPMDYVKRWRHAWLDIIHVHVADNVLYDFIKLTKVNTERRSNAA